MTEAVTSQEPEYKRDMEAFYRMAKYPLVASSDCPADMKTEAVDVCVAACERHASDIEKCTQMIKDTLDKRFGGPWHVVVGRAFSFEVTHEVRARVVDDACGRAAGTKSWV
ncbi:Dynein light chain 4 [Chlorella vulgaris]